MSTFTLAVAGATAGRTIGVVAGAAFEDAPVTLAFERCRRINVELEGGVKNGIQTRMLPP